jgi:hypothetical protein
MLEVNQNVNLNSIEILIEKIRHEGKNASDLLLDLPVTGNYTPGIVSSLIQFFATWSRSNNSQGRIFTKTNLDNYLKFLSAEILQNPQVLCLFAMNNFDNIYDYHTRRKARINHYELLNLNKETEDIINLTRSFRFYKSLINHYKKEKKTDVPQLFDQNPDAVDITGISLIAKDIEASIDKTLRKHRKTLLNSENPSLFFGCFDKMLHFEYPSFFYDSKSNFNSNVDGEFVDFIKAFLSITKIRNKLDHIKESIGKEIATVLYELIENTEKWAKDTADYSQPLFPNIRGAYLCLNFIGDQNILNPSNPINDFITRFKYESYQDKKRQLYAFEESVDIEREGKFGVLEISIIDSGPGYVARNKGIDVTKLSFAEEKEIFLKCFEKHFTSDSSNVGTARGLGLDSVIKAIKNRGLIRVRTGRLSLYRNFLDENLTPEELESKRVNFLDWFNHSENYSKMEKVEGALITILYPFAVNI